MYTLIGTVKSRAIRPLWLLEELGVDFEHIAANPHTEQVTAVSPSGKIPVLIAEGRAIADSTAILTFLADRHGSFTFPAGTLERAEQDSLTHRVLDELDSVLWTAARHSFILPEEMRVPAIKEPLKIEFAASLARLSERLGDGPFLMGETMTIADIIAVHCGSWAVTAKFPLEDRRFRDYMDRLRDRPAFQRATAR
jgi:glutathione S-transferase